MNITLKPVLWTGMLALFAFFSNFTSTFSQQNIKIRPAFSSSPVDFSGCTAESQANYRITVRGLNGVPLPNVDVKVVVQGKHSSFATLTTDQNGLATFDYTGYETGVDRISAWTNKFSKRVVATKIWVPCPYADEDCDGVLNMDDLCHGGDDTIDNNNDDLADCAVYPLWDDIDPTWKCGHDRVKMCFLIRFKKEPLTICVKEIYINSILSYGGFLGPCDGATCEDENFTFIGDENLTDIETFNEVSPYYVTEDGDFYVKSDPEYQILAAKENLKNEGEEREGEEEAINLYPNPAMDFISLKLLNIKDEDPIVSILDITGKKVLNTNFKNLTASNIPLSELGIEPGAYLLQVIHKEGIVTKQFIVSGK